MRLGLGLGVGGPCCGAGTSAPASFTADILVEGDSVAGTATVKVQGTGAPTLEDDVVAVTAGATVQGAAAIALDDDSSSGAGTVLVQGSGSPTLEDDAAAGTAGVKVQGSSSATVEDDTVAGTGQVKVQGAGAVTVDDDTAAGTATIKVQGTASPTLAGDTAAGTGTLKIQATASPTLGDDTVAGTGTTGGAPPPPPPPPPSNLFPDPGLDRADSTDWSSTGTEFIGNSGNIDVFIPGTFDTFSLDPASTDGATFAAAITDGVDYIVTLTITNFSGAGTLAVRLGTFLGTEFTIDANGTSQQTVTGGLGAFSISGGSTGPICTIDAISVIAA